ncbi:MAG TPA: cyclic nucleotide-binding domain-containing protein, partial [bacterium]|nr:cyclic nucleotide-binding domain-containing protein [bacterium]
PEPSAAKANHSVVTSLSEVRKLRNVLQGVDFFTRLKLEELETLLEHLKKRSVAKGTLVIEQGDRNADAFYMIASGRCTVWKKTGPAMAQVDVLGPETYFGERALITDEPRAATVRAEEPTELYVLYRDDFKNLLLRNPSIAQELKFHMAQYRR